MEEVLPGQGARSASHFLAKAVTQQLPHLPGLDPDYSWAKSHHCAASLSAACRLNEGMSRKRSCVFPPYPAPNIHCFPPIFIPQRVIADTTKTAKQRKKTMMYPAGFTAASGP